MTLNDAIKIMTDEIVSVLADNKPTVYLFGSVALGDFKLGWSDIDILVLAEKEITEQQADILIGLRQDILKRYPGNPYFRLFEGGILSADAFLCNKNERTVYWGTSGQRITDTYKFDSFGMAELLDNGILVYGDDIRVKMKYPSYTQMRDDIAHHVQAARTHGVSVGWLLDIARGIYTLRTGKIIAKTTAGEWALKEGLCPDLEMLRKAVQIRKEPQRFSKEDKAVDNTVIQRFANVLDNEFEKQVYIQNPCGTLSTAYWKKEYFKKPSDIQILHECDAKAQNTYEQPPTRYFRLIHYPQNHYDTALPDGYFYRNVLLPDEALLVANFINHCYQGYSLGEEDILQWMQYPVFDKHLWVCICNAKTSLPVALGIADFDSDISEGSLEWIQVLPESRGRGLGQKIVLELLSRLKDKAGFITVSGEVDNPTNPELLYKKCGFIGDDIWYVFNKSEVQT